MLPDRVFIDTSAFYALLDRSDAAHLRAAQAWRALLDADAGLFTSSFVLLECTALVQGRLGFEAARLFQEDVLGVVETLWVDPDVYGLARGLWLGLGQRRMSLTDCAGFALMRARGLETAFAFDRHFAEQGFTILPG